MYVFSAVKGCICSLCSQSLRYLEVIHLIVHKRGWMGTHFKVHCEKWLDLLIQLIDITDDEVEENLGEVLSPNLTVTNEFKTYIKNQVNINTHL